MIPAVFVEYRKAASSVVVRSATALLILGIVAISASLSLASAHGNEQARAKLGPLADKEGWEQLNGMVAMISAPAALLGFGVVLSWMIGREFADETISGLFALPITRAQIVMAKLVVFWCWVVAVAVTLAVSCTALGLTFGYGLPLSADTAGLLRLLLVVVLTGLLAVPAAWAATLGQGSVARYRHHHRDDRARPDHGGRRHRRLVPGGSTGAVGSTSQRCHLGTTDAGPSHRPRGRRDDRPFLAPTAARPIGSPAGGSRCSIRAPDDRQAVVIRRLAVRRSSGSFYLAT